MNLYPFLPLTAFFIHLTLFFYVLYKNPVSKLNIIFSFVAISLATWGVGDFLVFSSSTPQQAVFWDKVSTIGTVLTGVFLLQFFLFFTNTKPKKIIYILYLFAPILIFFALTTDFISGSAQLFYWGYGTTGGILYAPLALYVILCIFLGLFFCYRFYSYTKSFRKKMQAKILLISIGFSFIIGIATEALPTIFGLEVMHLTSTFSTFTSIGIAYNIIKYKLMTPIIFSIRKKMFAAFLITLFFISVIGFCGYYMLTQTNNLNRKIIEDEQPIMTAISEIYTDLTLSRMKLDQYIATGNKVYLQDIDSLFENVKKNFIFIENKFHNEKEELKIVYDIKNVFEDYKNFIESLVVFYEKNPHETQTILYKKTKIDALLENALLIKIKKLHEIQEKRILVLMKENQEIVGIYFLIIISLIFLLIFFGALTSILIIKSITNPIIKMVKFTEHIKKGEFGEIIEIKSDDEIGILANTLNKMSLELKKYYQKIKQHEEELEKKVEERTRDLNQKVKDLMEMKTAMLNMMEDMDEANKKLMEAQKQLEKSFKELKELDKKKDEFISIAAHELKTPLTSIHGFAQLLQSENVIKDKEKRNKYLKIMESESKRLANLVNNILNLSRIDLGTIKLSYEEIDIEKLVREIFLEMEKPIKEKGLEGECEIEKRLPKVITDKEKLTEILINLINNAIKYTPKGKIKVKVFKEKDNIHFVVKDTGIGIAKEHQEKIFERFYQVDSSYTREAGGTGLGLAICKEYLQLLGGTIWVESELGKGSEFHFTIPIKGPGPIHKKE
ncbi:MAG: ATP-binding protein [Candidatus Aenigmatarchaeota archaeon]